MGSAVTIDDIEAARERIAGAVRRTPVLRAAPMRAPANDAGDLWLKLECLQITGSFKARGAVNKLRSLGASEAGRGLVTASSGNHAKGVAYAGWIGDLPARIYLPEGTPAEKLEAIAAWGAEAIVHGSVWDEANAAALADADQRGLVYFHPFADPVVVAGQGTIGLEILDDIPGVDTVVVAIGGGGLSAGVALALKTLKPDVRVVGVEPVGAPTLYESLKARDVIELAAITTVVGTLAPRRSDRLNYDIIAATVDEIVLVDDDEMRTAAGWLWREMNVAAELSGAATMAALLEGRIALTPDERVCAIVCGSGTDGIVK